MSILATDDFERPDNADLGANWTPLSDGVGGGDNFTIVSGAAKSPDTIDSCEVYVSATWPDNQWSEVTLSATNANGQGAGVGPAVRCADTGTVTYYRFVGNGSGWSLGFFSAGSHTEIATATTPTFAAGDRLYLEVQGTTLIAKKNTTNGEGGTEVTTASTTTNGNISTGKAGICHSTSDVTSAVGFWQGGDFGAAAESGTLGYISTHLRPMAFAPGLAR
jgi:hypothetical protein